jgi:hypothetical protein
MTFMRCCQHGLTLENPTSPPATTSTNRESGFLDTVGEGSREATERFAVLLAQIDRIPERPDACDPLEWDERGLPR